MKVKLTNDAKRVITLSELPIVNTVIKNMKEDAWTAKEYAEAAARAIGNTNIVKVFEAEATICKDDYNYNHFEDNSNIGVWIDFTALIDDNTFVIAGAPLAGIWDIGSDKEENARIMQRWYIRKFKEV